LDHRHDDEVDDAGIPNTTISVGKAVRMTSDGELGVEASPARYKRNIQDMGGAATN
jgi:hypothetical protein